MQLPLFKTCARCNQSKFITQFVKHHKYKDGHTNLCKDCNRAYLAEYNAKRAGTIQSDTKKCSKCKQVRNSADFRKDKNRPDGRFPYCKYCTLQDTEAYDNQKKGLRHCSGCDQWLPKESFYPNKSAPAGLTGQCKECAKARARDWKNVNPEAYKAKIHKLTWDDPDARKAKFKAYYQANRESQIQRAVAYSRTPQGKARQAKQNHKRRMWVSESPATLTSDEWNAIIDSQDNKCAHCSREFSDNLKPTRDHIIPVSKGGGLTRDNTQALCKSCNSRKGNR